MATATLKAKLTLNDTPFQAGLRKAITTARAAGQRIKAGLATGLKFGASAGAIGALVGGAALAKGIKGAYDMGDALVDLQARTGATGEALLVLQQALADNGVEAGQVGTIVNKMQKAISSASSGSKTAVETFNRLGLSIRDLSKMSPDMQIEAIGRAINGIQDPAKKAAAAMEVFGKSGGELLAMFGDDNAIGNARKTMAGMGAILAHNAETFATISDRLSRVGLKMEGFMVGVASTFAPAMLAVTAAMERTDFAAQGERFGAAMQKAAEIFTGVWKDPGSILQPFSDFLHSMWAKAANFMVASFIKGFKMVGGYMLEAVNQFRAAHIAVFEEIMSKIPGSGYDKNKTIKQRMADATNTGAGHFLGKAAKQFKEATLDIKDIFGAGKAARRAVDGPAGIKKIAEEGRKVMIQSDAKAAHQPIGPQVPKGWKANPFANFTTLGFGGGGLMSGNLNSTGLGGDSYNRIRRGDAARRAAEQRKAKDPVEESNELLGKILSVTSNAWQ